MRTVMDDLVDLLVNRLGTLFNLDLDNMYVIGFSEGATFSMIGSLYRSDFFHGSAVYASGFSGGNPQPAATKIPMAFLTGTADSFLPFAQAAATTLEGEGHPILRRWPSGVGHSFAALNAATSPATVFQHMSQ